MNSHFQSSDTTWISIGLAVAEASGLGGSRSWLEIHTMPPRNTTISAGIDQTTSSTGPEYSQSGMWRARVLPARNHQAKPRVSTITGTSTASMTTVALIRISRSAAPIGPCGSSTPPIGRALRWSPPLRSGCLLAAVGQALAQHVLQRHRPLVLLQEVGDRLVEQILEGPLGLGRQRLQRLVTGHGDMDHLAHADLRSAETGELLVEFLRPLGTPARLGGFVNPGAVDAIQHEAFQIGEREAKMTVHQFPCFARIHFVQSRVVGIGLDLQPESRHAADGMQLGPAFGRKRTHVVGVGRHDGDDDAPFRATTREPGIVDDGVGMIEPVDLQQLDRRLDIAPRAAELACMRGSLESRLARFA